MARSGQVCRRLFLLWPNLLGPVAYMAWISAIKFDKGSGRHHDHGRGHEHEHGHEHSHDHRNGHGNPIERGPSAISRNLLKMTEGVPLVHSILIEKDSRRIGYFMW